MGVTIGSDLTVFQLKKRELPLLVCFALLAPLPDQIAPEVRDARDPDIPHG
jgi:hypothetical protein